MKSEWELEEYEDTLANADGSVDAPPAVAGASRPRFGEVTIRNRGHVPHWEKDGGTYFITFRLADSLPRQVLDRIESERQAVITTANQRHRALTADERRKLQQLSTPVIENFLDAGSGACHLRNSEIAEDLANTLRKFERKRYRLFAWCIMPNHVHALVRLLPGEELSAVVHSWKSFSAQQANRVLGTRGTFGHREYYDHLIRGEEEFERAVRYIAENPAKSNLKGWKSVWVRGRDARATSGEDASATVCSGVIAEAEIVDPPKIA